MTGLLHTAPFRLSHPNLREAGHFSGSQPGCPAVTDEDICLFLSGHQGLESRRKLPGVHIREPELEPDPEPVCSTCAPGHQALDRQQEAHGVL